jgi:hypothetical protein
MYLFTKVHTCATGCGSGIESNTQNACQGKGNYPKNNKIQEGLI